MDNGWETVGKYHSLGRAPFGGSETEAWTPWTDGKLWEIAWGELRWEGARRKRGHGGRTGKGGKYSLGARWKRGHGGRMGKRGK